MIRQGDTVVLSIEEYNKLLEHAALLDLRAQLLQAEADRLNGAKTYTLEETMAFLDSLIEDE